jgi:hypothetical protein
VSVIGGLITSTFLSLVAVPAAYMLMASIIDWWNAKRGKPADTAALAPAAGVLAPAAVPPREPGQRAA